MQPNNAGAYNQYGQYQRYRQMSLDDMLLENRIVFLIGEISYQRAADVIMKMLAKDPKQRLDNCDQLRIMLSNIGQSRI